jgi:hypothetical protein
MPTRKELVEALRERYRSAAFGDRIKILDEFVALTAYHRKHAIPVLRENVGTAKAAGNRNRLYDDAVRQALTVLWEPADRVCGKRLKALIPMLVDAWSDMAISIWTRSSRPRSCRSARRPLTAYWLLRVCTSTGSVSAAKAWATASRASR